MAEETINYTPQDGFPYYYHLVKDQGITELFASTATLNLLSALTDEKADHRYASDKWSIKQIVGHITDHERIKMFRAFQLSRNEMVELWGYDQNALVANSRFKELTLKQLLQDLTNVRNSSKSFVDSLSQEQLKIKGDARQYQITLEEFLKSIIGHEIHHLNIIKERYLSA